MKNGFIRRLLAATCGVLLLSTVFAQAAGQKVLSGHVPAVTAHLTALSNLAGSTRLNLAIGLPLRNQDALTNLLRQIYDPASPNYHHYLTPEQFTEQFGPTEARLSVRCCFCKAHGLTGDRHILQSCFGGRQRGGDGCSKCLSCDNEGLSTSY